MKAFFGENQGTSADYPRVSYCVSLMNVPLRSVPLLLPWTSSGTTAPRSSLRCMLFCDVSATLPALDILTRPREGLQQGLRPRNFQSTEICKFLHKQKSPKYRNIKIPISILIRTPINLYAVPYVVVIFH